MTVAAFVFSAVALAVSLVGLGWELRRYALEGGRLKVELLVGAMAVRGDMVTGAPGSVTPDALRELVSQGFKTPIIGVKVRNVGRAPISVERWSLRHAAGMDLVPIHMTIGKPLPCRIEPGASETWVTDMADALRFKVVSDKTFKPGDLRVVVELGDGRKAKTPESFG